MAEALAAPARSACGAAPPCAVVIPVFNGYEHVERCVACLERHTPPGHDVWLVDDASPDPRMLPLLRAFAARRARTHLVENPANLGFVGAVNAALSHIQGDVVVLNADTQVTAGWLEALVRCRASSPRIGIACPLSNNATLLSIPALATLFEAGDADAVALAVRRASRASYPRIPTAVGFCMLVTRELLEATGPLDRAYGRGYGEENDLSMRALDLGFEIACCDDAYVHHAGEASFGEVTGTGGARERNRRLLERRWPAYAPGVSRWMRENPLRPVVERINAECERLRMPGRPRVLHVLHGFDTHGGVEEHTRAMIEALRHDVAFNVAAARGAPPGWMDFSQERIAPHLRISRLNPELFSGGVQVLEFRASVQDEAVERAFNGLLAGGFDVVHFHSPLAWNTMQLPRLAREAGSRVVLSAHDMAWMCAEYNMVTGPDERPCGRTAARAADRGCIDCLRGKSFLRPPHAAGGISGFIEERFAAAAGAIAQADAIVCPSRYVAGRVSAAFGADAVRNIRVIGHGVRDLPRIHRDARSPALTVALVGRFSFRKGAHHYIEAARRLQGERIVFEAWGQIDEQLRGAADQAGVALRGPYRVGDLPEHLRGVDLVVIPSTLEETYCLTLSEMHALGIPVAATRSGAIPERIRDGDNGFLFEVGDIDAMVALFRRLRDDRATLARVAARIATERPTTTQENAARYLELYRELAALPRTIQPVVGPSGQASVERAMGLPRTRLRTPLGGDDYDRWLAAEPPPVDVDEGGLACIALEGNAGEAELRSLNRAIADARAEWVVLLEAGDTMAQGASALLAAAARAHPRAAMMYGDHDAVSERGERYDPAFKPAFDVELLRHEPYIAGACAVRRDRCIAMGGVRAPGWLGVIDLALRLARLEDPALVVRVPALLVHRLDANLARLAAPPFRRAMNEALAPMLRALGEKPMRLAASADAPAMWAHGGASFGRVSVFLRCRDGGDPAASLDALVQSASPRIGEVIVDLDPPAAEPLRAMLVRKGIAIPVHTLASRGSAGLADAFSYARHPWLALVDARCRAFVPGWLERLEQGLTGRFTAAIAPELRSEGGAVISGGYVLGAGEASIAGAMPPARDNDALGELYRQPRAVSCVSPHLSLWRREAVDAPRLQRDLAQAGRFDFAHLCLQLLERGHELLARPGIAASISFGAPSAPPAVDAAWMRARWGARLDDDAHFHPAIALTSAHLAPAPRFAPVREGATRICAFPFDRWGTGHLRVLQPCAALERAGWADIAVMDTHETGRVPNGLEWRRLGADTLFAHNFFHDFQLAALDEYAQQGKALRVLGIDDLLTQLPVGNPYAATLYPDIAQRIARATSRCHRLIVSTEPLAEAYGSGIEVHVIPNAIDEAAWDGLSNRRHDGARPRVGWAGARQHLDDLRLLEPVVEATAREVDWIFLGMCTPALERHAAEVHGMVPVGDYPRTLASLGLDIATAPLADNPFNRAKSWLKVLEYGILGIPVVASDVTPYRATPAVLVRTADEWIDAIRALARDPGAGRARGEKLREWTLTNASLSRMLPRWRRALQGG